MISRVHVSLLLALPAMIPAIASAQPIPVPIDDVSHLAFRYLIEEIPTLGTPGSEANSNATGLNEQGDVAAIVEDDSWHSYAAIYRDGELILLDPIYPGGGATPRGINDLGEVCGWADAQVPPAVVAHPMVWTEEDGMVDLAADAGLIGGWAWGINNSGQVSLALGYAYVWDPVTGLQEIRYPDSPVGFASAQAWEINNAGVVCGEARRQDNELHAFRYDSATDTITDLHDAAAFRMSRAYGINDNNDVAGLAVAYSWEIYPMVWAGDGTTIQMGTGDVRPDLLYSTAEHINMRGDVTGHDTSVEPATPGVGWLAFGVLKGDLRKYTVESFLAPDALSTWSQLHPFEINEARQVCGTGLNAGHTRGFLLTPYPVVPGDFTTDVIVGVEDVLIVLANWGRDPVRPLEGDTDLDGDVDVSDFLLLLANWSTD